MFRKFNVLILLFLWMKGCEGGQYCKQYSSRYSSSHTVYYCSHYCCGSLYDDDCCDYDPGNSSGSSSNSSPSNIGKIVGASIGGIAAFFTLLCVCVSMLNKKKNRVQSGNLDVHPTRMASSKQYPGTTCPAPTPTSAAGTPTQATLPRMIHI